MNLLDSYWEKQADNHLVIGQPGQATKLAQNLVKFYNSGIFDNYDHLVDIFKNPDLLIIQEKLNIEAVRELEHTVALSPWRKRRVILVQNFATHESWNALLKILEETPRNTTILVRTLEPGSIPETIRSRLKVFHLGVEKEEVKPFLRPQHTWQLFVNNLELSKKPRIELEEELIKNSRFELESKNFKEASVFVEASKRIRHNCSHLITLDKMCTELLLLLKVD